MDLDEVELFVGLFSIWSCLGRLIAGLVSIILNFVPMKL